MMDGGPTTPFLRTPALLVLALLAASPARAQEEEAAAAAVERPVLALDDAVATALATYPPLRGAEAQVESAEARSDQALAPLLPQVRGSAGYQLSASEGQARVDTTTGTVIQADTRATSRFTFGLSASQLLYDFGGSMASRRSAQALANAQRGDSAALRLQVVRDTRLAYYTASAARALVSVAQETLENQNRHLEQVAAYVESDLRPEIDLAQARTDVANARLALVRAQNDYELARLELNQQMGVETGIDYDVALEAGQAPVAGEDGSADALVDEALRQRPELAAYSDRQLAQTLSVDAARSGYWPTLSLGMGVTESGDALDALSWAAYVGLSLDWAFYQGGRVRAQVRQAEAELASLEADGDLLAQGVRLEVQRARLGVGAAAAAVEAAQEARDNAREQLRLAEGRYETGVGSALERGDAQLALSNAQVQLVQAQLDLATARAQLLAALGRDPGAGAGPRP